MPPAPIDVESMFDKAETLYAKGDRAKAKELFQQIVTFSDISPDESDIIRCKELSIQRLNEILLLTSDGESLIQLLYQARSFFYLLPKAKTTNMVRKLFESIVQCGIPLDKQYEVCLENVKWAREEKRTFLRQRLQLRQVELLFELKQSREALAYLIALLKEVRRLDDRTLLLDIHLLETKIYYSIRNTGKAKAALVSARTTANSIYCPPLSQAEIDLLSGILHAEEYDYKTAFSYLFESFEGFHGLGDQARLARRALVYMILCKIQTDQTDELKTLLSSKNVLAYKGSDIDAVRGVAEAYGKQDTHQFNAILESLRKKEGGAIDKGEIDLLKDEVVRRQLEEMYDKLMERHLLRLIQPYNRVQISYLAQLLHLEERIIESRISKLILDKRLSGIVDQQHNCLLVLDDYAKRKKEAELKKQEEFYENAAAAAEARAIPTTTLHQDALEALEAYDGLVSALFDKVNGKYDALVEENIQKRKEQLKRNQRDEQTTSKKEEGAKTKKEGEKDSKEGKKKD